MPEVCEDRYQNSAGADLPKFTPETEVHVPRPKHIPRSMSCFIRDDLHVRAYQRLKGHLLTPTLKIRQTRTEHILQWHVENRHENIRFTGKKIFTIEEQYNCHPVAVVQYTYTHKQYRE
jgi:hypothetical protein